jgi:hypothetical protein
LAPLSLGRTAAFAACLFGALRVTSYFEQFVPGDRQSLRLWSAPWVDSFSPALGALISAASDSLLATIAAGAAIATIIYLFTPRRGLAYCLVLALCVALTRTTSPLLVAYVFHSTLFLAGVLALLVRTSGAAIYSFAAALFLLQVVTALSGI